MTANKNFYNFEKIEERGQKKFKKIIAHNPPLDALPRLGAVVGKWQLGDCFGQPMLRPRHPQLPTNLHLHRPILGETLFNLRKQFQKRPLRLRHAPAGLRKRGGVARQQAARRVVGVIAQMYQDELEARYVEQVRDKRMAVAGFVPLRKLAFGSLPDLVDARRDAGSVFDFCEVETIFQDETLELPGDGAGRKAGLRGLGD